MKISTLLNKAKKCKTDSDTPALLEALREAFQEFPGIAHLGTYNEESYLEEKARPFVSLEFNREISSTYMTSIRPLIRDGCLTVKVTTSRAKDGLGFSSQNHETIKHMDDDLECDPSSTVLSAIEWAVTCAKRHHRMLVEQVGIPATAAKEAVDASW